MSSTRKPRVSPFPNRGAITISNGQKRTLNRGGNFVRVRQADQVFTIRVDDDTEWTCEQNDAFGPFEETFSKLEIINDSGNDLTFQLEVGYGKISSSKTTVSGDIKVKNADSPNNILKVDDDATQAALAALQAAITDLMKNANDQRAGLTDLTGASYGAANNTTNTVVTAGANLNGVIIRTASVSASGSTQIARLTVGGNDILKVEGTSGGAAALMIENIFVPAGMAVVIVSSGLNAHATISYEVL